MSDKTTTTDAVIQAAAALLAKIDDITTEDFSRGGERDEREALRRALLAAGVVVPATVSA